MTQSSLARCAIAILIAALPSAAAHSQAKPIRIGIAKTFLVDQPKSIAEIAEDDFKDVLKKTTGLDGELASKYGAAEIADKLDAKQLDFGIIHGHEYAWLQKKHPDLRALLMAASKQPERAYVIVHQNCPAKTIADLRGKPLDMPIGTKEPCRVFLEKYCLDAKHKDLAAFFSAIEKSPAPNDALDNVARGKVQAAIIDAMALEFYKEVRGPVFAKNLRVLQQSDAFPPAVILYKPGTLDQATLNQFRDGLLKAHTNTDGRAMMKSWCIEAFEPVGKDYDKRLAEVLKAYPPR
jgi:ABC-type phosphate/phosphonate transport system substrate-binding protein